jgi:hypothetical protein
MPQTTHLSWLIGCWAEEKDPVVAEKVVTEGGTEAADSPATATDPDVDDTSMEVWQGGGGVKATVEVPGGTFRQYW